MNTYMGDKQKYITLIPVEMQVQEYRVKEKNNNIMNNMIFLLLPVQPCQFQL